MIHIGKNTRSRIVSKGISTGNSKNTYRGFVNVNNNDIHWFSKKEKKRIHNSCTDNDNTIYYIP